LVWEKTKTDTTKANIQQSKEMYCKHTKKLKPGIVAFYDIRPGNKTSLFSKEDKKREEVSKEK